MVVGNDITVVWYDNTRTGTLLLRGLNLLSASAVVSLSTLSEETERIKEVAKWIFHFNGLCLGILYHADGHHRRQGLVCGISKVNGLSCCRSWSTCCEWGLNSINFGKWCCRESNGYNAACINKIVLYILHILSAFLFEFLFITCPMFPNFVFDGCKNRRKNC